MGRASGLEYGKYGSWDGCRTGYRYSPQPPTRLYPTPGTPLPRMSALAVADPGYGGGNMVVGLISVEQLSLDGLISDIRGITEGYNLVYIGRISNHFVIPGTE